jgi:hypothetical protein
MDPIAATQLAADVAGIFLKIVNTVKEVIETMKGAKEALIELLSRCERVRLYVELFRSLVTRLSTVERSISLSFNDSAYRQTADEILGFVHKIADASKHSEIWMKFSWVFYKADVTALVGKLEAREKDLNLVLTFIAAYVSLKIQPGFRAEQIFQHLLDYSASKFLAFVCRPTPHLRKSRVSFEKHIRHPQSPRVSIMDEISKTSCVHTIIFCEHLYTKELRKSLGLRRD